MLGRLALSIAGICSCFILTGSAIAQSGQCYKMTKKCGNKPAQDIRKGKSFKVSELPGICAAISLLADLEMRCGISAPPGAPAGESPSDILSDMLGNGDLCKEIAADPKKVGASASNPIAGNGPDGAGCDYTTTGHPGINVGSGHIPRMQPGGGFSTMDLIGTIGALLHELYHLYDTTPGDSSKEYEDEATAYAIGEMCKVAGCDMATQEEKDAACSFIEDQNKQRCKAGLEQICCDDCMGGGKIHCEGDSGGAEEEDDGGGGGAQRVGGSIFLDTTVDENYSNVDYRGRIELNVANRDITFTVWDVFDNTTTFVADLSTEADFWAVTFTRINEFELMVGGWDSNRGGGKLLRLGFDPYSGQVLYQTEELFSSSMTVASSLDKFPASARLAVGDHVGNAVFVYNYNTGVLTQVADVSDHPAMDSMNFVHVWKVPAFQLIQPGGPLLAPAIRRLEGRLIWFTRWLERHVDHATLMGDSVHIVDKTNDGTFETIY